MKHYLFFLLASAFETNVLSSLDWNLQINGVHWQTQSIGFLRRYTLPSQFTNMPFTDTGTYLFSFSVKTLRNAHIILYRNLINGFPRDPMFNVFISVWDIRLEYASDYTKIPFNSYGCCNQNEWQTIKVIQGLDNGNANRRFDRYPRPFISANTHKAYWMYSRLSSTNQGVFAIGEGQFPSAATQTWLSSAIPSGSPPADVFLIATGLSNFNYRSMGFACWHDSCEFRNMRVYDFNAISLKSWYYPSSTPPNPPNIAQSTARFTYIDALKPGMRLLNSQRIMLYFKVRTTQNVPNSYGVFLGTAVRNPDAGMELRIGAKITLIRCFSIANNDCTLIREVDNPIPDFVYAGGNFRHFWVWINHGKIVVGDDASISANAVPHLLDPLHSNVPNNSGIIFSFYDTSFPGGFQGIGLAGWYVQTAFLEVYLGSYPDSVTKAPEINCFPQNISFIEDFSPFVWNATHYFFMPQSSNPSDDIKMSILPIGWGQAEGNWGFPNSLQKLSGGVWTTTTNITLNEIQNGAVRSISKPDWCGVSDWRWAYYIEVSTLYGHSGLAYCPFWVTCVNDPPYLVQSRVNALPSFARFDSNTIFFFTTSMFECEDKMEQDTNQAFWNRDQLSIRFDDISFSCGKIMILRGTEFRDYIVQTDSFTFADLLNKRLKFERTVAAPCLGTIQFVVIDNNGLASQSYTATITVTFNGLLPTLPSSTWTSRIASSATSIRPSSTLVISTTSTALSSKITSFSKATEFTSTNLISTYTNIMESETANYFSSYEASSSLTAAAISLISQEPPFNPGEILKWGFLIGFPIILLIVITVYILLKKKKKMLEMVNSTNNLETMRANHTSLFFPIYLEVNFDSSVRPGKILSQGGFGIVYEAEVLDSGLKLKIENQSHVAVKVFKGDSVL